MGDLIDNLTTGFPINLPIAFNIEGKLYKFTLDEVKIADHTIEWNKGAVTVTSLLLNTVSVQIKNISLTLTAMVKLQLIKFIHLNTVCLAFVRVQRR